MNSPAKFLSLINDHVQAVRQLHREFLRAGADVMQAFTFYASEDKLINRGEIDIIIITVHHSCSGNQAGVKIGVDAINREACKIAKEVAGEGDALVLGGVSQCPSYLSGKPKHEVQAEYRKQINVFVEEGLDFLLCEVLPSYINQNTIFLSPVL